MFWLTIRKRTAKSMEIEKSIRGLKKQLTIIQSIKRRKALE